MTNTSKLKGKIAEKGYTISSLAQEMHISRPTLRSRINNTSDFKSCEILKMQQILDISMDELNFYFFYGSCPQNGTPTNRTAD